MSDRTARWGVYGHDWSVDHLQQGIANGRIRQAYLIVGAESVGKKTLARAFASALLCTDPNLERRPCGECPSCKRIGSGNHPDVLFVEREGEPPTIRIEGIRAQMNRLALKPFEGAYRFGIFPDFDLTQGRVQDALLKTLEEPASHAILVLLARSLDNVLPTITSRSQILHLRPASVETVRRVLMDHYNADEQTATLLAHLSGGRTGWAIRALDNPDAMAQRAAGLDLLIQLLTSNRTARFEVAADLAKDKTALGSLLSLWQSFWRDLILLTHDAPVEVANVDRLETLHQIVTGLLPEDAKRAMDATNRLIDRLTTNINMRLALEVMLLDYPGLVRG